MSVFGDYSRVFSTGIEGGEAPSQARPEDHRASDVSDRSTACLEQTLRMDLRNEGPKEAVPTDGAKHRRRGTSRIDTRYDEATVQAVRTRAKKLGLTMSAWVRSVVRDALDVRRTSQLDAIVASGLRELEASVQASADAQVLAEQIRPLAINVNDISWRARAGEAVVLADEVPELLVLLREVRELLGDRVTS